VSSVRRAIELDGEHVSVFDCLAEALTFVGEWEEAESVLERRFQRLTIRYYPIWSLSLPDVLTAIFRTTCDGGVWTYQVGRLSQIASAANKLPELADSLIRSLTRRAYTEMSPESLTAWADVWHEVAEQHPDLSLAARLFGVGVRYVQTKDERVLLDLLQEERAILQDLFGLASRDDDS